MSNPVAEITKAPAQVVRFAKGHIIAFVMLAIVLFLLYVAIDARKPTKFREIVSAYAPQTLEDLILAQGKYAPGA